MGVATVAADRDPQRVGSGVAVDWPGPRPVAAGRLPNSD